MGTIGLGDDAREGAAIVRPPVRRTVFFLSPFFADRPDRIKENLCSPFNTDNTIL